MFKHAGGILAAVILSTALLVGVGANPAAAKPPPQATGIANCNIFSGSGTLNPGLTPAGSPGGVKITFTASLNNPTGQGCPNSNVVTPAGVRIIGGTVTGSGYYSPPGAANASACANFDGPDIVGTITVRIHWMTTGGPIANTTIVYKNNPNTVSGSPTDTIKLSAPPGTAVKHGSFISPASQNTTELKTDLPGPACGPGPFTTFHILGGFVLV